MNPSRSYQLNQPSSDGGQAGLGWWLASAGMALALAGSIFILVSMLTDSNSSQPANNDQTQTDNNDTTSSTTSEADASSNPSPSINPDANTDTLTSYGDVVLPLLPISRDDYVFLTGYNLPPDDNSPCWAIGYTIAFKGSWQDDVLDDTFGSDAFFMAIKQANMELYSDLDSQVSQTAYVKVRKFNGGQQLGDYIDISSEDKRFYGQSCNR